MLALIAFLVALVCWAIAAVGQPAGRVNLVAAGLFAFGIAWWLR
jgi:hypothetical protein